MRPNTLAEAVERIQNGASQDVALAEFVDTFDLAPTSEARYATIEQAPALTNDKRIDALLEQLPNISRSSANWGMYRIGLPQRPATSIAHGIPVLSKMTPCANT
jgi:hypothetical protein